MTKTMIKKTWHIVQVIILHEILTSSKQEIMHSSSVYTYLSLLTANVTSQPSTPRAGSASAFTFSPNLASVQESSQLQRSAPSLAPSAGEDERQVTKNHIVCSMITRSGNRGGGGGGGDRGTCPPRF